VTLNQGTGARLPLRSRKHVRLPKADQDRSRRPSDSHCSADRSRSSHLQMRRVDVLACRFNIDQSRRCRSRPSAICVGILPPASHIAYFQAVNARCWICSPKSACATLGRSGLRIPMIRPGVPI
jgi:hypothetical protein